MYLDKIGEMLHNHRPAELSCSFSPGIIILPGETVAAILAAIADRHQCDSDSSQCCGDDSGVIEVHGITVCWKIDYDDPEIGNYSADPSNWSASEPVLNIFRVEEY